MAFTANVEYISTKNKVCVVSIKENSQIFLDSSNIGLELNPDGTANTVWIQNEIKKQITSHVHRRNKKTNRVSIFIGDTQ